MSKERDELKSTQVYDVIRVIATIMVVIGHSGYTLWILDGGHIGLYTANASAIWNTGIFRLFNILRGWIYSFHMPLFFFLSGALYRYSKNRCTLDMLVKNKILRLLVPYFFAGLFWMIPIKYFTGFYDKSNVFTAVDTFLMGGWSGHLWFLLSLFWCFILYYGFEKYICRKSLALAGIGVIFIYYLNSRIVSVEIVNLIPGLSRAIGYFPCFFAGDIFEKYRTGHMPELNKRQIVCITMLLFAVNLFEMKYSFFPTECLRRMVGIAWTYFVSVCLVNFTDIWKTRLFGILLKNCFYIYLLHDPLNFIVLRCFINKNWLNSAWGCYLFLILRTIGTILIPIIIGEMIEKIKRGKGNWSLAIQAGIVIGAFCVITLCFLQRGDQIYLLENYNENGYKSGVNQKENAVILQYSDEKYARLSASDALWARSGEIAKIEEITALEDKIKVTIQSEPSNIGAFAYPYEFRIR